MNSNLFALGEANPLININLKDIIAQFAQLAMLGGASEVERIKGWIENRAVADLAEYRPTKPHDVAKLCADMVARYPDEVTVLLWNEEIAVAAMALMREMKLGEPPETQEAALALAQAVLGAGHEMDVESTEWPLGVSRLLQERCGASKDYAARQVEKFRGASNKGGLEVFRSAHVPFLSKNTDKSAENFCDGVQSEDGKPLERRHLLEASRDDRKRFLAQINQRKVLFGYEALEKRCVEAKRSRGEHAVQCTPESFGQLLVHMASRIPPGESQTFGLSFSLSGDFGNVRDMMVFLENTQGKGPMALKVSLYDPEITGDMLHLRGVPEELAKLPFYAFDLRKQFSPGSVDVMNLMLNDWDMAMSLRGRYIPSNSKVQVESLLNALAYGSLYSLQKAITELGMLHGVVFPIEAVNARSKDLAIAFHEALVGGHAKVIEEMSISPLLLFGSLAPATLQEMAWAKDRHGVSGLCGAMNARSVGGIVALSSFLFQIKDRLNVDVLKKMIMGSDVLRVLADASKKGFDDVVKAYEQLLKKFRGVFGIMGIRDFLPMLHMEHRGLLVRALQMESNDLVCLLNPYAGFLLQRALESRDKDGIRAYLELVLLVRGNFRKLQKVDAAWLLEGIRDICSPRFCCMRVDSADFKRVVKSDEELNALFRQAERSLAA